MKNQKTQTQTQTQHSNSQEGGAEVTSLSSPRRYKELYVVEDRPDGRGGFWTRVGVAFETKNGHWSLKFTALPVGSARVMMMDPKPKEGAGDQHDRVAA